MDRTTDRKCHSADEEGESTTKKVTELSRDDGSDYERSRGSSDDDVEMREKEAEDCILKAPISRIATIVPIS